MPRRRRPIRPRLMTQVRDGFRPVTSDDVSDLALLPKRFEQHRGEVKDMFEMLTTRIATFADRIEGKIDQLLDRTTILERDQRRTEARIEAIEIRSANHEAE